LHDVWAVDLPAHRHGITLSEFLRRARQDGSAAELDKFPPIARALFHLRFSLGRIFRLEAEPKNAEVLNKVGVAYQQIGDLDRSGRFYKRSMKADKNFASAVNNYGTVEYEKKHYGKSISLYKKAIVLRPELPTLYSNLGYAYFCNKEYPEALTSFEKALTLDPTVFDRKANGGTVVQQRSTPDPGLFYFFVAKSFAQKGDAEHTAHYLKLARDDGYAGLLTAQTDPGFAKVIKDPGVQEVLHVSPAYASNSKKTVQN
jgi:tetratricopeptide (TPR) repeat protein